MPYCFVARAIRLRNLARELDVGPDDLVLWLLEHRPELGELHHAAFVTADVQAGVRAAFVRPEPLADPVEQRCADCIDAPATPGRRVVAAPPTIVCERCGGSVNRRESLALIEAFTARRLHKLLVVGGGPGTVEGLRSLLDGAIELRVVDGEITRNAAQAESELRWADVVVIWASTILPHKISNLYTDKRDRYGAKIVVAHRRGAAALCRTVVEHLERRTG